MDEIAKPPQEPPVTDEGSINTIPQPAADKPNKQRRKLIIVLLLMTILFLGAGVFTIFKNKGVGNGPVQNKLSDKDIIIVIEPNFHNDNGDLVYWPYKDNGLVNELVEYTIINNSSKTIYFMGTSGGYQNPITCKVNSGSGCEILPQEPHQGVPGWGEIKPGGKMTGFTFYPLEKYQLVFKYLKEPQNVRYYGGVLQGIDLMMEPEFEKKSSKIYSSTLQTEKIELTKQSTLDICNSLKNPEPCLKIYRKEFGADGYPMSINKLVERQDLLIGDEITVEGKIIFVHTGDENQSSSYTIWVKLYDINENPMRGSMFLYENGDFVFCDTPQKDIPVCKDWINGKTYQITGKFRKGLLGRTDASISYYLDVKSKKVIN